MNFEIPLILPLNVSVQNGNTKYFERFVVGREKLDLGGLKNQVIKSPKFFLRNSFIITD